MNSSRKLVKDTLNFSNISGRVPRQLWTLPWATKRYKNEIEKLLLDYPDDIVSVPDSHKEYTVSPIRTGDLYAIGDYIDEWGCKFTNLQEGIIGEVKKPLIDASDEEWEDSSKIHIPTELLTIDKNKINEFCASTDKFVMQGDPQTCFERLQWIRGTENLFVDLILRPKNMMKFMEKMHEFNCQLFDTWAQTNIDALFFGDDWGTQTSLLINPKVWVELFKPMYRDYSDIAKKYGKKIFFHSDGNTIDIIPHLIDIGIDAANLQIFCIGVDELMQFKGKITFWGEIDRQNLLPFGSVRDIKNAVENVKECLWQDGGAIAQCEFGPGALPNNVYAVFESWNSLLP